MSRRTALESVFLLHARPFRNSSLLVELFSKKHGCLSVVANSARGPKSRYKGVLQPFRQLLVAWSGKRELKSLGAVELMGMPIGLQGTRLFCGYYLNELLVHLLAKDDPYERLFECYHQALLGLADQAQPMERVLRQFEKQLLVELGYGVMFDHEAGSGRPIEVDQHYSLIADRGFVPVTSGQADQPMAFLGEHLLAIAKDDWSEIAVMQSAKKILRYLIHCHMGGKPIHSRELIKAML